MSTEVEFDMNAAVAEVGAGLGFDTAQEEEIDNLQDPPERKAVEAPAAETEVEPAEESAEGGEKSDTPEKEEKEEPASVTSAKPAPRTWRAEAAKHWDGLPDQVKDEIIKREQDIFTGLNEYKEAATFGNAMGKVLEPYVPLLQQYGINPANQVQDLMQSHYTLSFGTVEQKQALLQRIITDYKIPLEGIGSEPAYVDPEVRELKGAITAVRGELDQILSEKQTEIKSTIEKQVTEFASRPEAKYFNDVMPQMTSLLQKGLAKNIEDAYNQAIYLNPVVRQKVQDEEYTRREQARITAEKERAARVAKATGPAKVVSRQVPGGDTTARGSMDDTLNQAYNAIMSRD